jgi:hypothetical protein
VSYAAAVPLAAVPPDVPELPLGDEPPLEEPPLEDEDDDELPPPLLPPLFDVEL